MQNDMDDMIVRVKDWGVARGLINGTDGMARAQLLKCMSKLGELADAELKGLQDEVVDGVGDTLVTLILYCANRGLSIPVCLARGLEYPEPSLDKMASTAAASSSIPVCLASAYEEISTRTGRTVGGTFIKD